METKTAVYGMAWSDGNTPGYISTMLYPIFDSFYGNETTGEEPKVVAFTSIDLFWQAFIERILPPGADGIFVVIENAPPCDQSFTFEIHGNIATFLDDGDKHETTDEFDEMKESFVFGSRLMEPISSLTYTGRPLYGDFCPYTFHVYPSQELKNKYVTSLPAWYTVIACSIFLFTSLVFLTYDCLVERRQALVMDNALKSGTLISSLFPSHVRDRLLEEANTKSTVQDNDSSVAKNMSDAIPENSESTTWLAPQKKRTLSSPKKGLPIAEKYENSTVLFADLAGYVKHTDARLYHFSVFVVVISTPVKIINRFTKWSSSREPTAVFQLLETLCSAFDKVADKRKVCKIESESLQLLVPLLFLPPSFT